MKINYSLLLILLAGLLTGCASAAASTSEAHTHLPTPTLNSLFQKLETKASTTILSVSPPNISVSQEPALGASSGIPSTGELRSTPTADAAASASTPTPELSVSPTASPAPPTNTPRPVSTPQRSSVITGTIYAGTVDRNWVLQNNYGLAYKLQDLSHSVQGKPSLAINSSQAGSTLFFQVRPNSSSQYLHDKVLGLAFWLNSGNNTLNPGDLSLTVTGSNKYPYYQFNDRSADSEHLLTRSGTRLYDLGLNRPLPPNTWVLVEIILDDLVYDPGYQPTPVVDTDYRYVTGFYLTTEVNSLQTFYLSQVGILLIP